jgi:hypothetical protein
MLTHRQQAAGFTTIEQAGCGVSRLPALAQELPQHAPYSRYVEAIE